MDTQPFIGTEITPAGLALREIYDQLVEIANAFDDPCTDEQLHTYMAFCCGSMLGLAMRGLQGIIPDTKPEKPWRLGADGLITQ